MECQSCCGVAVPRTKSSRRGEDTGSSAGRLRDDSVELQPGPVAPVNDDDKLSDGVTETVDCGGGFASKTSGNRPAEGKVCDVEPSLSFCVCCT